MKLSLGPILYYWDREKTLQFYEQVADTLVDIVYLGETVCARRTLIRFEEWLEIAAHLRAAGKEVVLSTMALLEAESELKRLHRICDNGDYRVEANDMGAVNLMQGRPFVGGHSLNIYNTRTLNLLAVKGMCRWVLPVELSKSTLAAMQAARPEGTETEVFAYGRLPLAYSARCFTARAHKLPKDDCQYRCLDYPDGMTLSAQDQTRFLALNGIQTQSAQTFSLLDEIGTMQDLGVDVVRLSPQSNHMEKVIDLFARAILGEGDAEAAVTNLNRLMPVGPCDGYWHGDAGMLDHSREQIAG